MKEIFFCYNEEKGLHEIVFDDARLEVAEKIIEKLQDEITGLLGEVESLQAQINTLKGFQKMVDLSVKKIQELAFETTKYKICEEEDILVALKLIKEAKETKCNSIWDSMGVYELK